MLKKKIRSILIKLGLTICITVSLFNIGAKSGTNSRMAYANSNTYNVSQSVNQQEIKDTIKQIQSEKKMSKGKILIYNSHSCEKNQDSTIQEISSDLKLKLEKKGYIVEQNLTDFANQQGYNKSYHSSGAWLETLDLSQYVLTIDCHMDSTPNPVITGFNENNVAKLMFPNVSENPNLKHQTELVNKIKDGLESFSDKIYRNQTTNFRQGIRFYNLNRNPNMLLVEIGSDKNTFLECRRTNTLLASAIERALVEK